MRKRRDATGRSWAVQQWSSRLFKKFRTCVELESSATVSSIKTVAPSPRFLLRPALTLGLAVTIGASGIGAEMSAVPDYQIGDKAGSDVITPIPLVVFDPARTEALRQAEARKTTPIFRHVPDTARQ